MVCASALSFLDGKICAIQEPSIIIIIILIIIIIIIIIITCSSAAATTDTDTLAQPILGA